MIDIKKAKLSDLDDVVNLFSQYRAFYGKSPDEKAEHTFLKQKIENEESELFLAREENDKAVGFVQLYPLFSSTRLKRFWLLNDLFVHSEYRGKGISRKLIERAKKLCIDTNACGMYLETEKNNDIGNNLYPSAGFELMDKVNFYNWDVE